MTPKEKADELFNRFWNLSPQGIDRIPLRPYAKRCALIAVEEIDTAIDFDWMEVQNLDRQHAYWQQVKEEIEKL